MGSQGSRIWSPRYPEDYLGLRPGYIKPANLAWYASHHHTAAGLNEPYEYSYLFAYPVAMPPGTRSLTLPNDDKVRIFAISVADGGAGVAAVQPLFDSLPPSVSAAGTKGGDLYVH